MAAFRVEIIASNRIFFSGRVQCVVLPGLDGEIAVLAHHEEMIVAVRMGEARFQLEDGTWKKAVFGSGLAEVANNRMKVLVVTAEYPEEIDAARARAAYENAQEAMRQHKSMLEYHQSKMQMARAMARLRQVGKTSIND